VNGRAVALGLCVLATVIGCSPEEDADHDPPAPTTSAEKVTGAQLCEMVPEKFVQDRLGIAIASSRPSDRDTKSAVIAECHYEKAGDYSQGVSVGVTIWPGTVVAKERVRLWLTGFGQHPADYEEVDGLADAAGFGPIRGIEDYYTLEAVTTYEHEYRTIDVNVVNSKPPTLEQVRPIAERVLQELDG
jgi:hypothetical protein